MPRKKSKSTDIKSSDGAPAAGGIVLVEPERESGDGDQNAQAGDQPAAPEARNWGNPYKALVTTATFEMGENRQFKQRVFKFREKPADEILATLKENGFTYRPNEKAWTIPANPDTRRLTDHLADEFGGASLGMKR